MASLSSLFNRAAYALLSTFEDSTGTARPLWRDYSKYQLIVNMPLAAANGVRGVALRSTISWGYADPYFHTNYHNAGNSVLYRTSYHVSYPDQPVMAQVDNWYRAHSVIDVVPRTLDLELQRGMSSYAIAEHTLRISDLVLSRDGIRPMIYSRVNLINAWLAPYWSDELMNAHFWWLAQYLFARWIEHPGPPALPNKVRRDRVVLHQTADKKPGFPGEQNGSASVDWDRWEIGNEEQMRQWIDIQWGGAPPPPPDEYPWYGEVIASALNVRSGPGIDYAIVGYLVNGDRVEVWRQEGDWLLIDQEIGRYVHSAYIKRL